MNTGNSINNPFVGLRPFEFEDSLYFFGREQQTRALLTQLNKNHFAAVVGSSGSGKSSLVRAGLVPHLEGGFLIQDRDAWLIVEMKPGESPLGNLATELLKAIGKASNPAAIKAFVKIIRRGGVQAVL